MNKKLSLFSLLFVLLAAFVLCQAANAQAYEYPIGIPNAWIAPDTPRPARPNPWTSEQAGYYYVNYQTGSDSHTYGTPSAPRQTIPNPIPAGSYVEVHGTYSYIKGGVTVLHGDGSQSNPVWIVGVDGNKPIFDHETVLEGEYLIVDNCIWTNRVFPRTKNPSNYIMLRNCDISAAGATFSLIPFSGESGNGGYIHDFIVYNNDIHDSDPNWDDGSGADTDAHGSKPGDYVYNVWYIDNRFYNIGGNAIQIGDQNSSQDRIYNIYLGRNDTNGTRQSAIGIKKASDVIISQNTLHNTHDIYNGAGNTCGGIAYQYAPKRIWMLFNTIYDADDGIKSGSDTSPVEDYIYIIGNEISNIHHSGYSSSNNGWTTGAGLMLVGSTHISVVNNTITDADIGITTPGQNQYLYIENNIISNITSDHIRIQYGNTASLSTLKNNIIYESSGNERIRWGNSAQQTLASLTVDSGCYNIDPKFVSNSNFHLQPSSPAKDMALADTALTTNVYALFQSLYGKDIRVDVANIPRPQGSTFDIGAYEYDEGYAPPPPGGLNPPAAFKLIQQ